MCTCTGCEKLLERGMSEGISGNRGLPSLIVRQAAARAGPHSTRKTVWYEITGGETYGTTGRLRTGSCCNGRADEKRPVA